MKEKLKKLGDCLWELPQGTVKGMNAPAWIFLSDKLLTQVEEGAVEQAANVACLPGIHKHSIALPDMHFGYGFPIGGVAALDAQSGGLSPGGIGFDINCGVRLLRTNLRSGDIRPVLESLVVEIFHNVPSGVGKGGKIRLSTREICEVLEMGARWAVEHGYGTEKDIEHLEEKGCMKSANSEKISSKAMQRGAPQLGSLGAGNHFLEIQRVDKIYQPDIARTFGISHEDQICVMIHTGSRGFGHQVCTDYLRILEMKFREEVAKLPDRELVYAPAGTKECEDYFAAMSCAANFAWCNRQMINHWVRESMTKILGMSQEDIGIEVVYDVAHNIGKLEEHVIDGEKIKAYVHRKGGTRCFGPGSMDIPKDYRSVGQPVLVPGDMGSASYVLVGTKMAEEETFSSVCHGAGRLMSRHSALKQFRGERVKANLASKDIFVRSASWKVLAEEAPGVYKDIHEVVRVCEVAGISKTVAKLIPMGVVKG
ncbi:MAG: RtcB family protein [Methanocellales archaeon]|nr:RtcB family protein [Methanocellales archaeon]